MTAAITGLAIRSEPLSACDSNNVIIQSPVLSSLLASFTTIGGLILVTVAYPPQKIYTTAMKTIAIHAVIRRRIRTPGAVLVVL